MSRTQPDQLKPLFDKHLALDNCFCQFLLYCRQFSGRSGQFEYCLGQSKLYFFRGAPTTASILPVTGPHPFQSCATAKS
jgi:hypothetical protein